MLVKVKNILMEVFGLLALLGRLLGLAFICFFIYRSENLRMSGSFLGHQVLLPSWGWFQSPQIILGLLASLMILSFLLQEVGGMMGKIYGALISSLSLPFLWKAWFFLDFLRSHYEGSFPLWKGLSIEKLLGAREKILVYEQWYEETLLQSSRKLQGFSPEEASLLMMEFREYLQKNFIPPDLLGYKTQKEIQRVTHDLLGQQWSSFFQQRFPPVQETLEASGLQMVLATQGWGWEHKNIFFYLGGALLAGALVYGAWKYFSQGDSKVLWSCQEKLNEKIVTTQEELRKLTELGLGDGENTLELSRQVKALLGEIHRLQKDLDQQHFRLGLLQEGQSRLGENLTGLKPFLDKLGRDLLELKGKNLQLSDCISPLVRNVEGLGVNQSILFERMRFTAAQLVKQENPSYKWGILQKGLELWFSADGSSTMPGAGRILGNK